MTGSVTMSVDVFGGPSEGGGLKDCPEAGYQVVRVVRGVRGVAWSEDFEGRLVIAYDVDGPCGELEVGA